MSTRYTRLELDAADAIAAVLADFTQEADEYDSSHAAERVRAVVRLALRSLEVYDAGGCPLCLG